MSDAVVVIKLEDDAADVGEALSRLEALVTARGLGEIAGHMKGLGTIVFIDVAPGLRRHVEARVLPALRALVDEVGLKGATVELPPDEGDDDDWDDDADDVATVGDDPGAAPDSDDVSPNPDPDED